MKCRTSGNKAQTTVVACVNAIGQAIPPYVIYNAKTLNPEWIKDGPPGTKYAHSENGWIDTELFELWFNNIQQATSTDLRWAQDTLSA